MVRLCCINSGGPTAHLHLRAPDFARETVRLIRPTAFRGSDLKAALRKVDRKGINLRQVFLPSKRHDGAARHHISRPEGATPSVQRCPVSRFTWAQLASIGEE